MKSNGHNHAESMTKPFSSMGTWMAAAICFGLFTAAPVSAQSYLIPVVYHILYTTETANITDAQVMNSLDLLNERYNQTEFTLPLHPPFDSLAANMEISFCLASLAPDGSPTTGILRYETSWAVQGGDPGSYVDQWPPDRYLNIWTVQAYVPGLHRTLLPEEAELTPEQDGVMVAHYYLGTTGTSDPLAAHIIVQRVARYLNLKYLFEDPTGEGECGDDGVADTPPCELYMNCNLDEPSCEPGSIANTENYMNYTYCPRMFTFGQKERTHLALNSAVAARNNLWTAWNLALTGCGPAAIGTQDPAPQLKIWPVPFQERITIGGVPEETRSIELMDLTGRTLRRWDRTDAVPDQVELNWGKELSTGTYLLKLLTTRGSVVRVIQKG